MPERGCEWIFLKRNPLSIFAIFKFEFIVFNITFNNISVISWLSVLLVKETGVPGENHRHVAITDKLYQIMLSRVPHAMNGVWTFVVINNDCIGSYKSNSHAITTTTASFKCQLKRNNTCNTGLYNYRFLFGCLFVCLFVCLSFLFAFVHFEVLCNS